MQKFKKSVREVASKKEVLMSPLSFALIACGGGQSSGTTEIDLGTSVSTTNLTTSTDNDETITLDTSDTVTTVVLTDLVDTISITDTNTTIDGTVTEGDTILVLNSKNLNSHITPYYSLFEDTYYYSENLVVSTSDQTKSESYLASLKNSTSTKPLTGKNEIDSLLYEDQFDDTKTEYWDSYQNSGELPNTISFSFFDTKLLLLDEADYSNEVELWNNGFFTITEAQKEDIRGALGELEEIINVKFVEVTEINDQVGTIRFGISKNDDFYAFAYQPGEYWPTNGDIWFGRDFYADDFDRGTYEFGTLLHELGHAMGLSHPFEGGAQTMTEALDYTNYTIMSYTEPDWAFIGDGATRKYTIGESYMVYDIQALQHMYGANYNYNSGDTVYLFDSSERMSLTIWDGGGEDILDFSDFDLGCDINLNDGTYSTLSYTNWKPIDNIGIAFNCYIENVVGSKGDDTIVGNELSNEINGHLGNDTMFGGDGDDIFDWNEFYRDGDDIMYGGGGDDVYVYSIGSNDRAVEYISEGTDTIFTEEDCILPENVEILLGFGSGHHNLEGNNLDNVIRGNDISDILTGHGGADVFLLYLGMGNDLVTDFNQTEGDEIQLAYGLETYEFNMTELGAIYTLSDGSSLELNYV